MDLRIVGGALGGRRFAGPVSKGTRPTPERAREALASVLLSRDAVRGARVLDLFGGTGALAFELLSRGAASAAIVERDRRAVQAIRRSIAQLELDARAQTLRLDLGGPSDKVVTRLRKRTEGVFDLVVSDPPYQDVDGVPPLVRALGRAGLLASPAWVAIEHAAGRPPRSLEGLASEGRYRYGDTALLLAAWNPAPAGEPDTR